LEEADLKIGFFRFAGKGQNGSSKTDVVVVRYEKRL